MSNAIMGTAVFSLRSVPWKCFLWGLIPGYITRTVQSWGIESVGARAFREESVGVLTQ
jgi:hypothetical protein